MDNGKAAAHFERIGQDRGMFARVPCPAFEGHPLPDILGPIETVELLAASPDKSLARIGDGELNIAASINGGAVFQTSDTSLAEAIRRVVADPRPQCLVGLNMAHFFEVQCEIPFQSRFRNRWSANAAGAGCAEMCSLPRYVAAEVSIARMHYRLPASFWNAWYAALGSLFDGKDVLLVAGESAKGRGELEFYRDHASSVVYFAVPDANAWDVRGWIKERIERINAYGNYTVVLACGPTATVLAWELSPVMRCLDMGHLGKEYAWWKHPELGKDGESDRAFYAD